MENVVHHFSGSQLPLIKFFWALQSIHITSYCLLLILFKKGNNIQCGLKSKVVNSLSLTLCTKQLSKLLLATSVPWTIYQQNKHLNKIVIPTLVFLLPQLRDMLIWIIIISDNQVCLNLHRWQTKPNPLPCSY